jgi:hypothetical protein
LPNVRELEISETQFRGPNQSEKFVDFKLKHLTKLEIFRSASIGFFVRFVPATLKILKIELIGYWELERWDKLLGKQKKLEELSLKRCLIRHFKLEPENCHIEKLDIHRLKFQNDSAFEQFSEFMKIQESVVEFKFSIQRELWETEYRDIGILEHLISLKSLKKFCLDQDHFIFNVFSESKVCNPAVETLTIVNLSHIYADLTSLPKLFPNVTDLKITWHNWTHQKDDKIFLDFQSINSMKKIRKLEIECVTERMLSRLELKELRELCIEEIIPTYREYGRADPFDNLSTFINNNCQLEILHLLPKCCLSVEQFVITLENLPLLKSLEFTVYGCDFIHRLDEDSEYSSEEYKKDQAEEAAQLIGENYDRLEHLKLDFEDEDIRATILNYLEEHYPDVKLNI